MHCVLLNILPEYHRLLGGTKAAEDTETKQQHKKNRKVILETLGEEAAVAFDANGSKTPSFSYIISQKQWKDIGQWQERSRPLIPALLGQAPRPINTRFAGYKAMEWEAFLIRDGMALLSNLGNNFRPYLMNFRLLRRIYLTATSWRISPREMVELKENCIRFVRDYESLFYDGNPAKMKHCKINQHSLLYLGKMEVSSRFGHVTNWFIYSSAYRIPRPRMRLLGYIYGTIYWIIERNGRLNV